MTLYLASSSPRRAQLLRQIGVQFSVISAAIDESPQDYEAPDSLVLRLAREKAMAGLLALQSSGQRLGPVLGADTVGVLAGRVLQKPLDRDDAIGILSRLSGQTHQVLTAVAVALPGRIDARLSVSDVTFRPLSLPDIEAYWASGEPKDKAGAYGIQGFGGTFVRELRGSYSGVVGLPLFETAELLQLYEVPVWQVVRDE